MNYSVDLRQRVINWVLDGHARKNASEVFEVHYQTVKTWVSRYLKTGECTPPVSRSTPHQLDLEALRQEVQSAPDSCQNERACRFGVVPSTSSKARSKLGLTRKNQTTGYLEPDEEQKRAFQLALQSLPDETVWVYLDECGIPQSLYRESGWAPQR